ncbi:MAG TPA: hypothetical protein VI818_06740, partial [Candidatus Thermoplasmatota archaeon]|nr:hypothetical protein [Candidatus Thermoplasmatota archaeon]
MRTYRLVVAGLLVLTLGASAVSAEEPLPVDDLLRDLLGGQDPSDSLRGGSSDEAQDASDTNQKTNFGSIASVLLAATIPMRIAGDTLATLGLNLVQGLYAGVSEGAKTV